ncbi:C-terminal binding protein [Mycobacterium sp. ITM-2016-00317]|uniref:C-terminal binding protein n=1 Tax=Mycobacterium sp. ITM-2016-00317 TaxID=2099694 RepID=UPI00287F70AF|nr:C-terminal binding protein [Mycobacterium sp. ITM-2016-00317]WNG87526.1 C-terminal binding protein [Mycobacterium sp. ITM-2016-00317]
MTHSESAGVILIAPHHFPHLEREEALADETGRRLVVAANEDDFHSAVGDAEIVMMTPYAKLGAEDFTKMTACRAVVRYGMGYDNIDVDAASAAGVPVSIVPDASTEEVAAHALAMGLALVRRLPHGHNAIHEGGWAGSLGTDTPKFSEMEVGIVGMGRIGRLTAGLYKAVGATVHAYDPVAQFAEVRSASLTDVLEKSDVVSLHLPLNADTRNLVDADVIARMRQGAVLVNVSRGGLVDEAALAEALRGGHLSGAALDVFSTEPLPADNPLRGAPRLILTPHIAWRSNQSLGALQSGAVNRVRAALAGNPLPDVVTR